MVENADISKSTVIILVILTLAVSMIGTWAVLEEVVRVGEPTGVEPTAQSGKVQLRIVSPDNLPGPVEDSSGAQVGITINPAS